MKLTKLDLYKSAHAAAVASLDLGTKLQVDQARLAAFTQLGLGEVDYEFWVNTFDQRRETMLTLAMAPADSAKAAPNAESKG